MEDINRLYDLIFELELKIEELKDKLYELSDRIDTVEKNINHGNNSI